MARKRHLFFDYLHTLLKFGRITWRCLSLTSKLLKGSVNYLLIVSLSAWFCIVGLPAIATGSIPHSTARQNPPIPSSSLPETDEPIPPFLSSAKGNQTSGESLEQQAKTLYEGSRFSEASQLLEQALQGYQNTKDTIGQAVVLSNLALSYQQLGMWTEANQAIEQAFTRLKQSPKETPERSVIWAQALDVQGSLQLAEGKAAQAVDSWEKATTLYTQLEKYNRATRSQINQAQALQALGLYRQARLILEDLQNNLNSQPSKAPSLAQAENLRSLGEALRGIGILECNSDNSGPNSDCVDATTVLDKSLKIAQQLQSPAAIAAANLSLGNVAWAQSQVARERSKDDPARCQEIPLKKNEALNFYQEAMAAPIPAIQTQAQLNYLRLLVELQQWQQAQAFYPQIQQEIANLPPGRSKIYAQVNFATSLSKLRTRNRENERLTTQDAEEINQILIAAAQEAERLQDVRSQALVLEEQGQLYQHTQQLSTAQNLTRQALNLSQSINASEISYQVAWQLGRILREQGKIEEAIAAYTQAYEALKSVRGDLVGTNPDIQFSFRESVKPVYRELVDLLLQSAVRETVSTLEKPELFKQNLNKSTDFQQDKLKQAREVLDALQVAELQNYFQQACEDVKLELDNVVNREAEKGQKAAVIYPIILENRLEIILKLPNQETLYQYTPVKAFRNRIEETLNEFQNNLRDEYKFKAVLNSGEEVYNWLIKPFRDRLEDSEVETLIFILDDSLRTIPMSALYDGEQFLVENYSVVLVLGLEVRDPTPLNHAQMKVLAASLTDPPKGFEQYAKLPYVNPELDEIKKAGVSVHFIRDEEFTKDKFNKTLNQENFQVVHLATHGQFGADPNDTYILTADSQIKLNQLDQMFRTLRGTKAVDLLILSACRTATGNDRAVLGIAGTAVKAGARSAIAGLWSLADQPSVEFTRTLYQYLGKANFTRAEALRKAQLALLNHPDRLYTHPRYWAPYVLVGSWL
ncbi:CHAT domain-containing protein [Coleofasciculus chthonoplastes]|uniref:CHAT domain-containing protein n=1 Tax=Coleofasciculus chthonoplastes TaxID=64178 RepID=UPI003303A3B1